MRTCVLRGVAPACCVLSVALAAQPAPFQIEETTIAKVHAAMRAHQLTCHQLVDAYLQRIAKYDKNEPPINAIVLTNPNALKEADELDRRFASGGLTGPLHCVPTIVKDNYETIGLQSADGSLVAQGLRVRQGRVSREAHQSGRRDRARQVEHGGVRVQPERDRQLAARHDAQPVRI